MCGDSNLRSALVTGASGGIGEAISRNLIADGFRVCLSGRNEDKLKDLSSELGENCCYIVGDISSEGGVLALAEKAISTLGGSVGVLVNNAGLNSDALTIRMSTEDWDKVLFVNLKAPFILSKSLVRGMSKNRWGRIVNISSVIGYSGNAGQANYAASKAGLVAMSKSMALEFSSRGITVNCVAPGFIETSMTDALPDSVKDKILSKIPMSRYGKAHEVASVVSFLVSEGASYITGEAIHVNGGMLMV